MSCKKVAPFDATYQGDCDDELFYQYFDAFIEYKEPRNADSASHNGVAKNNQSSGLVEDRKCAAGSKYGNGHQKEQKG